MKQAKVEKHSALNEIREQRPKSMKEELTEEHKIGGKAKDRMLAEQVTNLLRTHRLGNWLGKFHPSKSKKGIKRSE